MPIEPNIPPSTSGTKLLTDAAAAAAPPPEAEAAPAQALAPARPPSRQLSELPTDELGNLAEDLGLERARYQDRQALVAAIHEQRQLIASFSREALLEVVRWGRRPVPMNATNEQLAHEITRIRSMRFSGLSQRGLVILARLRGIAAASESDPVPILIRRLKNQESLFSRLNRKRRAVLGSLVSNLVGESQPSSAYQFLPPPPDAPPGGAPPPNVNRAPSIKEEIEDSGLFGGITNRLKKTADQYLNQKLDEIEARIDRKLDEIDRRLAEWRDKEIANRIRILKITLWASVIVGVFSLIYEYVKVYFMR